jgi:tellurite resistance protein
MSKTKRSKADIEAIAKQMQAALSVPKQNDVFRYAVEAGYLCALADGNADEAEKATLVAAMHQLSSGLVIEWEVDAMIDECNEHIGMEGRDARCQVVGEKLAELGQAQTGLLLGALVALTTTGLDKSEAEMLEKIGKAAGIAKKDIGALVKQARDVVLSR